MNIMNLFDGMSCGNIAIKRASFPCTQYYASEVDKHALKVSTHHFPEAVHLGDVRSIIGEDLPKIDLLMGGSPCQGFSSSGKQLNFNDPRSVLFFEYVRILKECNPQYFFLENVQMKQEYQDIITQYLGVEPVVINSSLVSAQNRVRSYWANFPITQPEDLNIGLDSIVDDVSMLSPGAIRGRRLQNGSIVGRRINERGVRDDYNKDVPISQCLEVRATNTNKSNCLTTVAKDNVLTTMPIGRHKDAFKNKLPFRYYTVKESCRLQTVPDDYFEGIVSDSQANKMLGNGWTVDVIVHILNCLKKEMETK